MYVRRAFRRRTMYSIDSSSGVLHLGNVQGASRGPRIAMSGGTAAVTYTPKFAYAAKRSVQQMFRCTQSMQPPEL